MMINCYDLVIITYLLLELIMLFGFFFTFSKCMHNCRY